MDIEKIFGETLKESRTEKGFSQERLAELCKLDRTYISLLERGQRKPTLNTLFKIAESLELRPSHLVERIERKVGIGRK